MKGLLTGGPGDARRVPGAEGPAGGREQDACGPVAPRPLQALEDGAMLAVHGEQRLACAAGGLHHQVTPGDQRLLVGQQHLPPGTERVHHALQPRDAHHAHQHLIGLHLRRGGVERFQPHHEAAKAQVGGDLLPGDGHGQPGQLGAELPHLSEEQLRVAVGGESLHLKAVGMQAHQFEGLGADGAGGAKNGQGGHDAIPPSALTWTPAAGSRT